MTADQTTTDPLRVFVPRGALHDGALRLDGDDAAALAARGVAAGDRIVALDGSGWAAWIDLTSVGSAACSGRMVERRLAAARRTKVSLYYSPLDTPAARTLAGGATTAGVVAIAPVFSSASRVDVMPVEPAMLATVVQEAAEAAGWGRRPLLGDAEFLDQAVDRAARAGAAVLMGVAGAAPVGASLPNHPFTVALFCPTAGAYAPDELARAAARGAVAVAWPDGDPVAAALAMLGEVFAALEPA